jgi:hypothetical protein
MVDDGGEWAVDFELELELGLETGRQRGEGTIETTPMRQRIDAS